MGLGGVLEHLDPARRRQLHQLGIGAGLPKMWTGSSAFVRSLIAGSAVAAVITQLSGSTSQKTGVAPIVTTGSTVAKKLREGTTTSSPGPTPSARSAIASASVPLPTPTQCSTPI